MSASSYIADCPASVSLRGAPFEVKCSLLAAEEDTRIVGDGVTMRRLRTQLQRLGPHFRTALISGEGGTGKELVARELHRLSPHADGPFVVFNAASVENAVIEWRGAAEALPTGADDLDSLLRAAHGGTLFFDRISELPIAMQAQLLEVLERKEFAGRSSRSMEHGETRIIASTSEDLRVLASAGRFRKDLYFKISAVEIALPPLRERMEDVPALVAYFSLRCAEITGRSGGGLTDAASNRLLRHAWPGNVLELKSLVCMISMKRG